MSEIAYKTVGNTLKTPPCETSSDEPAPYTDSEADHDGCATDTPLQSTTTNSQQHALPLKHPRSATEIISSEQHKTSASNVSRTPRLGGTQVAAIKANPALALEHLAQETEANYAQLRSLTNVVKVAHRRSILSSRTTPSFVLLTIMVAAMVVCMVYVSAGIFWRPGPASAPIPSQVASGLAPKSSSSTTNHAASSAEPASQHTTTSPPKPSSVAPIGEEGTPMLFTVYSAPSERSQRMYCHVHPQMEWLLSFYGKFDLKRPPYVTLRWVGHWDLLQDELTMAPSRTFHEEDLGINTWDLALAELPRVRVGNSQVRRVPDFLTCQVKVLDPNQVDFSSFGGSDDPISPSKLHEVQQRFKEARHSASPSYLTENGWFVSTIGSTAVEPFSPEFPRELRHQFYTGSADAIGPTCTPRVEAWKSRNEVSAPRHKYLYLDLRRGGFNTQLQSWLWALALSVVTDRIPVAPAIIQQENYYSPQVKYRHPKPGARCNGMAGGDFHAYACPIQLDGSSFNEATAAPDIQVFADMYFDIILGRLEKKLGSAWMDQASMQADSTPTWNEKSLPPPAPLSFFLNLRPLEHAVGKPGKPSYVEPDAYVRDCGYPEICVDAISHAFYGPFDAISSSPANRNYRYAQGWLSDERDIPLQLRGRDTKGGTQFLRPRYLADIATFPACTKFEGRDDFALPSLSSETSVISGTDVAQKWDLGRYGSLGPWNSWEHVGNGGHQGYSAELSKDYAWLVRHGAVPATRWLVAAAATITGPTALLRRLDSKQSRSALRLALSKIKTFFNSPEFSAYRETYGNLKEGPFSEAFPGDGSIEERVEKYITSSTSSKSGWLGTQPFPYLKLPSLFEDGEQGLSPLERLIRAAFPKEGGPGSSSIDPALHHAQIILRGLPIEYMAVHARRGNFKAEIQECSTRPGRGKCKRGVDAIYPSIEHILKKVKQADERVLSLCREANSGKDHVCHDLKLSLFIFTTSDSAQDLVRAIRSEYPTRAVLNIGFLHRGYLTLLPRAYSTDYAVEMLEKVLAANAYMFLGNAFSSISSTVFDWRHVAGVRSSHNIIL